MPTLRTYCSGGDLFGVGAAAAGWKVVDGFEINDKIAAVARRNGHNVHTQDVTKIDQRLRSPVDHEHASPSCKTASQANQAGGETTDDLAVAHALCVAIAAHAARGGRSWSLENVWGYRHYESFQRILAALTRAGFAYRFDHINMADYGVPQSRKRLILWAVHRSWRDQVPTLHPTHRQGGDMFHAPWVGWYEAIADLIPTLPETTPAPWQVLRLPKELHHALMIGPGGFDGRVVQRAVDQPAFTVTHGGDPGSTGNTAQWRAYLLPGENAGASWGKGCRVDDEPLMTVSSASKGTNRAYLCGGGNSNINDPTSKARCADDPAFTVRVGKGGSPDRALLLGGQSTAGTWKRLTLPCLARFQTVPGTYKGLTAEINGNGVPCLFAQRLMEALC